MDRRRMMIGLVIAFGLFLLMVGAILADMSNAQVLNETPEAIAARENLGLVWGPALAHAGMFFFVLGLVAAAVFIEEMDIFVRLFLLILAFVALLLVLANSPTIFG
ncbi:MAG TPA: hypothetical protein VIL45_00060 [Thermoplasmata archaeon]